MILKNNSQAFEYWSKPPATVIRKYYFFDIQNPIEVTKGTEKPRVLERGPYSYTVKMEKKNIQFLGDDLVRYSPVSTIFFNRNLSVGDENDIVTILNVPAMVYIINYSLLEGLVVV